MSSRSITQSQSIPSRRMLINDPSQLPNNYSTTPGGTMYSTTPGGTRLVYERSTILHLRNSPLSNIPPNIPNLPESILRGDMKNCQQRTTSLNKIRKSNTTMADRSRVTTPSITIPTRRAMISDVTEIPSDYSTTPGGTMYSTTPGGTRIIYDRATMLGLRNSPQSNMLPHNIPDFLRRN